MHQSSDQFELFAEGRPVSEDGPEHVHASFGEGDDGLMVAFSFGAFAVIEGAAVWASEGGEGGLVEDAVDFHRDVTRFFHRELTHLEIM